MHGDLAVVNASTTAWNQQDDVFILLAGAAQNLAILMCESRVFISGEAPVVLSKSEKRQKTIISRRYSPSTNVASIWNDE